MSSHAVVWLDQEQAKIFFFDRDAFDEKDFHAPKHHITSHAKHRENHHPRESREQKEFFDSVAKTLATVDEVLVLGPGVAKTQLLKHFHLRDPKIAEKVLAVETSDHPTPGQIVAHARHYFQGKDQLLGTGPLA